MRRGHVSKEGAFQRSQNSPQPPWSEMMRTAREGERSKFCFLWKREVLAAGCHTGLNIRIETGKEAEMKFPSL